MQLRTIVERILRERNHNLSWLALQMGKTFDGLRLGLIKGSVKYNDLILMAEKLGVTPGELFPMTEAEEIGKMSLAEQQIQYRSMQSELQSCKEMASVLKEQLKDKELIIELLNRPQN